MACWTPSPGSSAVTQSSAATRRLTATPGSREGTRTASPAPSSFTGSRLPPRDPPSLRSRLEAGVTHTRTPAAGRNPGGDSVPPGLLPPVLDSDRPSISGCPTGQAGEGCDAGIPAEEPRNFLEPVILRTTRMDSQQDEPICLWWGRGRSRRSVVRADCPRRTPSAWRGGAMRERGWRPLNAARTTGGFYPEASTGTCTRPGRRGEGPAHWTFLKV